MLTQIGRTLRKIIVIAIPGVLVLGFATTILTIVIAWNASDAEILRSTREADGVVKQVYEYRKRIGRYPRDLYELQPATGETTSENLFQVNGKGQFCDGWCWTYAYRGDATPPILFREADYHMRIMYEFAPSHGFYLPSGVNEGWVVRQEGDVRYLRSIADTNQ